MRPQRGNRVTKSGKDESGQLLSKFSAWNQTVACQFLLFNQLCMFFQNNQALLHSALEEASFLPSSYVDLLALFANSYTLWPSSWTHQLFSAVVHISLLALSSSQSSGITPCLFFLIISFLIPNQERIHLEWSVDLGNLPRL